MKILMHAHTNFSDDGELSPAAFGALLRKRGFAATLLTDHFEHLDANKFAGLVEACSAVTSCLMVPGYERDWNGHHILAIGVNEWFDQAELSAWASAVRSSGGMTVLAHPVRNRCEAPNHVLEACDGIEVWNAKWPYDGSLGPNPRSFPLLGSARIPLCGQDFHRTKDLSSIGLRLQADCESAAQILEQLRSGRYRMESDRINYGQQLTPLSTALLAAMNPCRRFALLQAYKAKRLTRRLVTRTAAARVKQNDR